MPLNPIKTRGFTLLEVMVSLALVLVLVLGINQVFSMTSKTVSTGQVLSEAFRSNRAIQGTVYEDMRSIVIDGAPCFIIRSERVYAWRNPEDEKGDTDGTVSNFDIGNGNVDIPTTAVNSRSHRRDRIGFFARNKFYRQTGADGRMVDTNGNGVPYSSNEAWIVYGHLWLPNNNYNWISGTTWPGGGNAVTNPNNYYAAQWVLGRAASLLMATVPAGSGVAGTTGGKYPPFGQNSNPNAFDVYDCRFDSVNTTMSAFRKTLDNASTLPNFEFWDEMVGNHYKGSLVPNRPLTSAGAAKAVPCLLSGCSQFIVEFAGDFVTQNEQGARTGEVPDGIIDFIPTFVAGTSGPPSTPDRLEQKVIWYGFPRDTNVDGVVGTGVLSPDVLPVSTRWGIPQRPFERQIPNADPTSIGPNERYIAAWGPDTTSSARPRMIRFVIAVDDFGNRMAEAQTFEYVTDVR